MIIHCNSGNKLKNFGLLREVLPFLNLFWLCISVHFRIKELTRGGSSQWKMYGDPTILASIDMHDVHPRSWSVICVFHSF